VTNVTLSTDAQGYNVEQVESTDASGNRVVVSTAYAANGDVAYTIISVTSPDGSSVTNSYDDNGDGMVDRLQTILTQEVIGNKIATVVNKVGSDAATALLASREVTTTSPDGANVTVQRDSTGGGWFDQEETLSPALGAFPNTVFDGQKMLLTEGVDADYNKHTEPVIGSAQSAVDGCPLWRHWFKPKGRPAQM